MSKETQLLTFPKGAVLYFVHRLVSFDGHEWFPDAMGINVLMFPYASGYEMSLVFLRQMTGKPDDRALFGRHMFTEMKRIEYFIYATAGEYAVREGFKHDFLRGDCALKQLADGSYVLFAPKRQLYQFYPIEAVLDKVNRGTGFKALQFTD